MRVAVAGVAYFALVMAAGFAFGTGRVLLLEPRLGARTAELLEMPLMLGVVIVAARWVVRRFQIPPGRDRLWTGGLAVALALLTEFTVVLSVRGMTIGGYFASLDPVSGTAFFVMQAVFAAMPALVERTSSLTP